jgi:cytochrome c
MKAKGGTWTYDELFKFLKSPGAYITGTKMSFAGLTRAEDRINLIAFLRTNADSPAAIPAPKPATPSPTPSEAKPVPAAGAAPATPNTPKGASVPVPTTSDTSKKLAPGKVGNQ